MECGRLSDPTVTITVEGDPFRVPWRFELLRPNMPAYHAECLVIMDQTASGDPHLRIHWKGEHHQHSPQVMRLLEKAIELRIKEVIPDNFDLLRMPPPE